MAVKSNFPANVRTEKHTITALQYRIDTDVKGKYSSIPQK